MIYTDGSVARDRSGWGFTVKQGGRTVHEDSGAHRVTTSSLTMEVEAVTHAIQWQASQLDARITHAVILTDSMNLLQKVGSGMGCPDHCCSEPVKSAHLGCTLAYPPPADPDTLAPAVSGSALSVWCRPSLFPIETRVFSSNCLCGRVFVSVFVWE